MKPVLLEDTNDPTYKALTRGVLTNFTLKNKRIPFAIGFDSTVLHFKNWTDIVFDPNANSYWKEVLLRYYASDEYKKLNELVSGDPLLTKYSTIHFLNTLLDEAKKNKRDRVDKKNCRSPHSNDNCELTGWAEPATVNEDDDIEDVVKALKQESTKIVKEIQTAQSFSHAGIPHVDLLSKPEEFRRIAQNRFIVSFVTMLNAAKKQASTLKRASTPTTIGGLPLGVKRIQRWSELATVYPAEVVDEVLLDYKIASKTLRVIERKGGFPDYVVYIDKSGSMSGTIPFTDKGRTQQVPKISFAAAAAMALNAHLRKLKAKMTLKPFDTDVHDEVTGPKEILDLLLRVRADGGTNLTRVLEDAYENHRDEKVVIISDGIDQVSEVTARKCRKAGIEVKVVFIKTDNVVLRRYFDCILLREAKPNVLLTI